MQWFSRSGAWVPSALPGHLLDFQDPITSPESETWRWGPQICVVYPFRWLCSLRLKTTAHSNVIVCPLDGSYPHQRYVPPGRAAAVLRTSVSAKPTVGEFFWVESKDKGKKRVRGPGQRELSSIWLPPSCFHSLPKSATLGAPDFLFVCFFALPGDSLPSK